MSNKPFFGAFFDSFGPFLSINDSFFTKNESFRTIISTFEKDPGVFALSRETIHPRAKNKDL